MKLPIQFIYKDSCGIAPSRLRQTVHNADMAVALADDGLQKNYETQYAALHVPFDEQALGHIKKVAAEKKKLNPTLLIIVGIGGSNLGTLAVLQALQYNHRRHFDIFWADTVDSDYIAAGLNKAEAELQKGNNILINVISKSGTTTETVVNLSLFVELLKKYKKTDFHEYVVATTDLNSPLWQIATKQQFTCLEVPKNVGGRFSVFTPVGLFPLALAGVDVDALLAGAREAVHMSVSFDFAVNYAALSATILAEQYKAGVHMHNMFLFSNALEGVGKWYRQLMGESIGKEFDKNDRKVNISYMPLVSIGSTDLHSVGQRYFAGPVDTVTTFVTIQKNKTDLKIPALPEYADLLPNVAHKNLFQIMDAIIGGAQVAYMQRDLPYMMITLPELSAQYIGYFLQWKMAEIIYLGYLLEIDPFDQPNVELYKSETKQILSGKI